MSPNSKLAVDEVKWLVWLFLGWTFWLGSGHAPQEKPLGTAALCRLWWRDAGGGSDLRVVARPGDFPGSFVGILRQWIDERHQAFSRQNSNVLGRRQMKVRAQRKISVSEGSQIDTNPVDNARKLVSSARPSHRAASVHAST